MSQFNYSLASLIKKGLKLPKDCTVVIVGVSKNNYRCLIKRPKWITREFDIETAETSVNLLAEKFIRLIQL